MDKITEIQVKFTRQASAIVRGYPKPGQCEPGMEGTPVGICSIYPPERASEGFRLPLQDWMVEIYNGFDVSWMIGIQDPSLNIWIGNTLNPVPSMGIAFGDPLLIGDHG